MIKKRKICVITGYRSEYLKMESALIALKEKENISLEIISIGAHNLSRFGDTYKIILDKGFDITHYLYTNVEGNTPVSMANSVGIGIIQISSILSSIKPDMILISADRYEILSAAIAACMCNIPLVHLQGGEISGTIDESIRHTITKLSHIHFPATEISKERIIRMGENKKYIFNVGCPAIDFIKNLKIEKNKEIFLRNNFPLLEYHNFYGIIIQHSVTTEFQDSFKQMRITLEAIQEYGLPCLLIWPNPDPGAEEVSRAIRMHNKKYGKNSIIIDAWKTMDMKLYLNLLYHSSCLIGNSSSGIRESHTYGVPTINIGNRQKGRERTKNIIDVNHNKEEIFIALKKSVGRKIYDKNVYGDGTAGQKIADILETINLDGILNKQFQD